MTNPINPTNMPAPEPAAIAFTKPCHWCGGDIPFGTYCPKCRGRGEEEVAVFLHKLEVVALDQAGNYYCRHLDSMKGVWRGPLEP